VSLVFSSSSLLPFSPEISCIRSCGVLCRSGCRSSRESRGGTVHSIHLGRAEVCNLS
jgi:hypothetical protein